MKSIGRIWSIKRNKHAVVLEIGFTKETQMQNLDPGKLVTVDTCTCDSNEQNDLYKIRTYNEI